MSPPRLLVAMPAWNEEDCLAAVIAEVRSAQPVATVLVVDDGSTDRTTEVALRAGAKVLRLPFNLGVGGAMRTAYRFAVRNGYDAVVQVDADGQHNPADIQQLLDSLDGADVVIGARFAGTGAYTVRGPRAWAMRLMSLVLSRLTNTRLTDTTSGFKMAGPRAVRLFADTFPEEYLGDTIEALVLASKAGLRIQQVPVAMRERMGGVASTAPIKSAVYLLRAGLALGLAVTRRPIDLEVADR